MPMFDRNLLCAGPVRFKMSPSFTEYIFWSAPTFVEHYDGEIGTRRLASVMTNGDILSEIGPQNVFDSSDVLKIIFSISQFSPEDVAENGSFIQKNSCYLIFAQDNKRRKMFIVTIERDEQNVWNLGYEDEAHLAWNEGVRIITKY